MTNKTPSTRPVETATALPDELRMAYQIHTLAQILFARLTAPTPAPWGPVLPPTYPPIVH